MLHHPALDIAKRLASNANFRGEDLQNLGVQRRFRLQQQFEVVLADKPDLRTLFTMTDREYGCFPITAGRPSTEPGPTVAHMSARPAVDFMIKAASPLLRMKMPLGTSP